MKCSLISLHLSVRDVCFKMSLMDTYRVYIPKSFWVSGGVKRKITDSGTRVRWKSRLHVLAAALIPCATLVIVDWMHVY